MVTGQPLSRQLRRGRQGCSESFSWRGGGEEPSDIPGAPWLKGVIQVMVSLLRPSAGGEGVRSGRVGCASYPLSHAQKSHLCTGLCVRVARETGLLRKPEPARLLSWGNMHSVPLGLTTAPGTSPARGPGSAVLSLTFRAPSLCPGSLGSFAYNWAQNLPPPPSNFVNLPCSGHLPGDLVSSFVEVSLYAVTLK